MGHAGAAAAIARVEIDRHLACAASEGLAEDQRPPREVRLLGETARHPAFGSDLVSRAVGAAKATVAAEAAASHAVGRASRRLASDEQPTGTADVHAERLRERYLSFLGAAAVRLYAVLAPGNDHGLAIELTRRSHSRNYREQCNQT